MFLFRYNRLFMYDRPRRNPNRDINLAELPLLVLLNIFLHIRNKREKIRLMRVCRYFYYVIHWHLSVLRYRLVDDEDYLYSSEIGSQNWQRIVNLTRLVRIAPHLTHFGVDMDRVYFEANFDFIETLRGDVIEPLRLPSVEVVRLNSLKVHVFHDPIWYYVYRVNPLLDLAPRLETLHLTVDHLLDYQIPRLEHLRMFKFTYRLDNDYFDYFFASVAFARVDATNIYGSEICMSPISFFGIIDGAAPNLQEINLDLRDIDAQVQLGDILGRLTRSCPNLVTLSIFFDHSVWQLEARPMSGRFAFGPYHLPNLNAIEILGLVIPRRHWMVIFDSCPNLKMCILERRSDYRIWNAAFSRNIYTLGGYSLHFHI